MNVFYTITRKLYWVFYSSLIKTTDKRQNKTRQLTARWRPRHVYRWTDLSLVIKELISSVHPTPVDLNFILRTGYSLYKGPVSYSVYLIVIMADWLGSASARGKTYSVFENSRSTNSKFKMYFFIVYLFKKMYKLVNNTTILVIQLNCLFTILGTK